MRGYTLVECTIVIALIALSLMLAIPTYTSYSDKNNRRLLENELQYISALLVEYTTLNNTAPDSIDAISANWVLTPRLRTRYLVEIIDNGTIQASHVNSGAMTSCAHVQVEKSGRIQWYDAAGNASVEC